MSMSNPNMDVDPPPLETTPLIPASQAQQDGSIPNNHIQSAASPPERGFQGRIRQFCTYLTAWFYPSEWSSPSGCSRCCGECPGCTFWCCSWDCLTCQCCDPRVSPPTAAQQYPMSHRRRGQSVDASNSHNSSERKSYVSRSTTPALYVAPEALDKTCAGICFYCEGEILLILRNSCRNDNTWDFPGGQIDAEDFDADTTQLRTSSGSSASITPIPLYEQNRKISTRHALFGVNSPTWKAALREAAEELGTLPSPIEVISAHNLYRGYDTKRYTLYLCKIPPRAKLRFQPPLSEEHVAWGWFPVLALLPLTKIPNITELPLGVFELHPWVECFIEQHMETFNKLAKPTKWSKTVHNGSDFYRQIERHILAAASKGARQYEI